MKPSAREFLKRANSIPGYPLTEKMHGFFYLRWPYLYIGTGTGSNGLGRFGAKVINGFSKVFPPKPAKPDDITFADTYHGKVVPLEAAKQLVRVQQNINIPDLEKVIPYKLARSLILDHPDHIVALDCPCRVARENPCLPLDVCLIVGEPFAAFCLEHHADRCRSITSDEAVQILEAEDARGHVHHAFFKEAVLQRFYAICNCCDCCCGAMQAQRGGTPMLTSSGYTALVDKDLCIGCGDCNSYCQFHAISVVDEVNVVDLEECMGCGVCISHCEQDAIQLILAPEKGVPLEMSKILDSL